MMDFLEIESLEAILLKNHFQNLAVQKRILTQILNLEKIPIFSTLKKYLIKSK